MLGIGIIIITILNFALAESKNQRDLILYLENKYDGNFVITEKIQTQIEEKELKYAYQIIDDNNIKFIAGKEKEKALFPLFPGFNQFIFFDNYIEQIKYAIIDNIPYTQKTYTIEKYEDIQIITNNIYNTMTYICEQLAKYGHDINNYSCSIDIILKCNNKQKKQFFCIRDLKYIQQKLLNFYNSQ